MAINEVKELIGIRCISQRPSGSRTSEIINYQDLLNFLRAHEEFEIIENIKKNVRFNSNGQATFLSGCGYDIISHNLLSNESNDDIKSELFHKYGLDFTGVRKTHSHLKNTSDFFKYRDELLKKR